MITEQEKKTLFDLYPVLSELEKNVMDSALAACRRICLARGTGVFQELDVCQAFPFVLTGELRVYKASESGRQLSLYRVRAGDACIVSAGCLLGDKTYNAAGMVMEDVCLIMMPDPVFDRLMAEKPFSRFVFSLISTRVLELMQLVEAVAFHRLDRRLASVLLKSGPRIRISHQDLADELGTVREMVTRILNGFADTGLVSLGRGEIEILDPDGLSDLAAV